MNSENESQKIIDEALEDVIQEMLIIDEEGVSHLVYIHRVYWNNGLRVEFSTPDSDKDALIPLVHDAVMKQSAHIPKPTFTMWDKIKEWLSHYIPHASF